MRCFVPKRPSPGDLAFQIAFATKTHGPLPTRATSPFLPSPHLWVKNIASKQHHFSTVKMPNSGSHEMESQAAAETRSSVSPIAAEKSSEAAASSAPSAPAAPAAPVAESAESTTPAEPAESQEAGTLSSGLPDAELVDEGSEAYKPGQFHPVYIGDVYNEKYLVLNKLGYGLYSTVWLVKDISLP